ncbi:MAG: pyrroloquinoline quinone biosynthesis protein PqqB [Flavobacteriales bacterium]|nr:pyrroloquinoline quinone biosynthesis protein PqqB [Flavobacteriales bacterium]
MSSAQPMKGPISAVSSFLIICLAYACTAPIKQVDQEIEPDSMTSKGVYVEVLGIAQDAGYPQIDCRRTCCSSLLLKDSVGARVVSLALVDERDTTAWLFEATPDIRSQWSRITELNSGKVPSGVFITHAHIGHYSGLMQFGRESMGAKGIPVYVMSRMAEFLKSNGPWDQLVSMKQIDLQEVRDQEEIALKPDISVLPISVPHRDEYSETVGYMITTGTKSLLFIPDIDKWERWELPIEMFLERVDYALLDGTFFREGELPGRNMDEIPHPFIEESMKRFSELSPEHCQKIHFIHFNHTNPVLWDSGAAKQIEDAGFRIAREGLRLELSN